MTKSALFLFTIATFFFGCEDKVQEEPSELDGLWMIESVKVGEDEMTPIARWTRFNSDSTFESGNGKFQHSHGTWKHDVESNELSFNTTNGLDDPNEPFQLSFDSGKMIWERTEEGQEIRVELVRSDELPETHGDKLIGLWGLKSAEGYGTYFETNDTANNNSLFFRWDKRFVLHSDNRRITGIYQSHGHRSEVVLVPDDDQLKRTRWEVQFDDSEMILKELNTDSTRTRHFERIRQFPE